MIVVQDGEFLFLLCLLYVLILSGCCSQIHRIEVFPFDFLLCSFIFLQIALGNILKFRRKNWQFDFIGGAIYFILVFSMFPQVCVYLRERKGGRGGGLIFSFCIVYLVLNGQHKPNRYSRRYGSVIKVL
jgi:hypothetical protein